MGNEIEMDQAEAALAAEQVRADQQITDRTRARWGGTDHDLERGIASVDLAAGRLGISEEGADEGAGWLGREGLLDVARAAGRALESLPPDMTPAEASEKICDLLLDKGFQEAHANGDTEARRLWDGLTWLASSKGGA